jgi:hypothetical protein
MPGRRSAVRGPPYAVRCPLSAVRRPPSAVTRTFVRVGVIFDAASFSTRRRHFRRGVIFDASASFSTRRHFRRVGVIFEPGPAHTNVSFTFSWTAFAGNVGDDDTAVYGAFKAYMADPASPGQPYDGWVRASCVPNPALHLCP